MSLARLAVLVSGRGSNLEAILQGCESGEIPAEVGIVVSDNPAAGALVKAARHGVASKVIERAGFSQRGEFEAALATACLDSRADLICLAGFMRLLGADFLDRFPGRVINIHPSLLPSFPGLHAQRQALEYGVKLSGCTVHFVTPEMDAGPIIVQRAVPVLEGDDEESLSERILVQEHQLYKEAIRLVASGRVKIEGRQVRAVVSPVEAGGGD